MAGAPGLDRRSSARARSAPAGAVLAALLLVACGGDVVTPPPGTFVHESATEPGVTEGETTIAASPEAAYAALVDYPRWPAIFPGITRVEIASRDGDEAQVFMFKPDGRDNLHFRNQPSTQTIWFEDRGRRALVQAQIQFSPGTDPGTSRVQTRLLVELHGFTSVFVSDRKLRSMRQQRVADVLRDLRAYFAPH